MAVVMKGGDEKRQQNPAGMFHDFLGMSCGGSEAEASIGGSSGGGRGLVSASSELGSERQGANNSEVFHFPGRKSAISGLEASNTFSGRKRSNSDSAYMGLIRDRMLPVSTDSLESARLMKTFGKEVVGERLGRPHEDELMFSMQPPPRPTSSLILQPPVSSRPDSLISKWERPSPMNPGSMLHYPSRFGYSGTHMDKLSSSYTYKDTTSSVTLISQAAADEGSRTGIKGSGILKVINPSSVAGERSMTGVMSSDNRPKAPQVVETESSNIPGRHSMTSPSRQMTIFYAGQAHVFDDVHPNKADVIMALAGSNGGSWSTTYSPKSGVCQPVSEAKAPSKENEMHTNNIPVSTLGISEYGHNSQVARIPLPSDLPSLTSGSHQGGKAIRDARLAIPAMQHDTDGKRDA